MKTKEEILKMGKEELLKYKWSDDLDKNSDCSDCSDCSCCRNIYRKKYMICNVQLTKEEYEKKMKELKNERHI